MFYRIVTCPPGYEPQNKYMVCEYETLDYASKLDNVKNVDGRPYFASIEDARQSLPPGAKQLPFGKEFQVLELWVSG